MNIFHTRHWAGQADLQVASDNSQDCGKKLEAKTADMSAKDQQLATITDEKTKIQEQLNQVTAQLEQANAASTALQTEKDQLANELGVANSAKIALHAEIDKLAADLLAAKKGTIKRGSIKRRST